ncbi:MAG: MBL fold metallo-hydrolase [Sciscionella sp.]
MCGTGRGSAGSGGLGRWQGRLQAEWIADDLALLRSDSASWPSPGNVLVVLDGDGAALVDCGFGTNTAIAALADGMRRIGRPLSSVHTVVCTHPHTDHAGAMAPLACNRRLLIPAGSRPALDDPTVVADSILPLEVRELVPALRDFDADSHFRNECGASALPADSAVEELQPGEVFALGRYSWQAVATPGHDAHLMCYLERRTGMLVYSDLLVTKGTAIPWYAPSGGGPTAYRASLRRVAELSPRSGVSGHGRLLEGPMEVAAAIAATIDRLEQRDHRIEAALANGPVSFTDLERLIYPPVVHDVIPWASSVAATHLLQALESGRARRRDGAFVAERRRWT